MKSDSSKNSTGLADFHPASRAWFEERFGQATKAQADAWPQIRAGRHTLIAAPTGSGKTLAAFYAAIDMLLQRGLNGELNEGVQILYVSPLKALSNDIQKNLEQPLNGIAEQLHLQGFAPVDIRIAVRTGDTPPSERARMAKKPPHILVTTPESFYLLLTSASGRAMLSTVRSLVVDEIHALLGDKRGSHLALSMERLQHLISSQSSGNTKDQGGRTLQRIGLSATQKPIDLVANYLVGNATGQSECDSGSLGEVEFEDEVEGADSRWPQADCAIVDSGFRRELDIRIEVPKSPLSALMSNEVWDELYSRLVELIESHDTTLVFVNTRRLSERLALALAERLGDDVVCSHHGSMSKDHRHNAEQRLKAGSLKVLVATASMELGIDVGSVDLVVQFSSPKSIATFLQRVGRSGHSINGTPKGILFPLTRDDLIEASAL
ncbi:DEAD/DEAH box helicase, partial [Gammaproteobacteria bacterium]|nr:DEAD/DEAH box helicase [Gammaproteobacteria bacterium]